RLRLGEIGSLAGVLADAARQRRRHDVAQRRQAAAQLGAELAVGAEQQDPRHAWNTGRRASSTSPRNGSAASLADNEGFDTGQSIASVASFQRTPASASRS